MRNIRIKNKDLEMFLFERGVIVGKARKITKEIQKLQKEQQAIGYKMERLKEKIKPIVDNENIELGEYEIISRIYLENKDAMVEIVDQIEEYKKIIKEKKKDEKNNSNNSDN